MPPLCFCPNAGAAVICTQKLRFLLHLLLVTRTPLRVQDLHLIWVNRPTFKHSIAQLNGVPRDEGHQHCPKAQVAYLPINPDLFAPFDD
jgi:hypothetical protein